MTFGAYLFDLDDTLYREHDFVRSGFRAVAARLSAETNAPPAELLYQALVEVWEREGRGQIFDRVCAQFALPVATGELVAAYRHHRPTLRLYDDAARLLNRLAARGVRAGLITDGASAVQWGKIRALGLEGRLAPLIVTDDLGPGAGKPSQHPFRMALERLGLPPQACVYVGDNPHKDFVGARRLGLATVRVVRADGDHMKTRLAADHEADWNVETLDDL